jgi:hypothetical protein
LRKKGSFVGSAKIGAFWETRKKLLVEAVKNMKIREKWRKMERKFSWEQKKLKMCEKKGSFVDTAKIMKSRKKGNLMEALKFEKKRRGNFAEGTKIEGFFQTKIEGCFQTKIEGFFQTKIEGFSQTKIEGFFQTKIEGFS